MNKFISLLLAAVFLGPVGFVLGLGVGFVWELFTTGFSVDLSLYGWGGAAVGVLLGYLQGEGFFPGGSYEARSEARSAGDDLFDDAAAKSDDEVPRLPPDFLYPNGLPTYDDGFFNRKDH